MFGDVLAKDLERLRFDGHQVGVGLDGASRMRSAARLMIYLGRPKCCSAGRRAGLVSANGAPGCPTAGFRSRTRLSQQGRECCASIMMITPQGRATVNLAGILSQTPDCTEGPIPSASRSSTAQTAALNEPDRTIKWRGDVFGLFYQRRSQHPLAAARIGTHRSASMNT